MLLTPMPFDPAMLGVVVRTTDGTFKVWKDGQWQVLDVPLVATEQVTVPPLSKPSPPTFPGPQAALYFSAAEEQEARRLAQRLDTTPTHKRFSLIKIVNQLQSRLPQPPSGAALINLHQAVLTFLRGTRHAIDFGALLMRSLQQGGAGLTAEQAQTMVAILTAINNKIHQEGGEVIDDQPKSDWQKLNAAQAGDINRPVASAQSLTPPPAPPAKLVAPLPPPPITPLVKIKPLPGPSHPVIDGAVAPAKSMPPKPQPSRTMVTSSRPKLADVKTTTKDRRLVGPVEELRLLDIATFRTLGTTPAEQAEQVVAKIQALGKDSLSRRAEGLAAWRQSEVYQVYREIGLASIQGGQSVAQVAANRFRSGLPTLTEAEFNAIADGNQKLRY